MTQIAGNPALRAALIYIALLVLGLLPLTFHVIRNRRDAKVGINDGGNKSLAQAIRVHGNYCENVPFALALLLALPLAGAAAWSVHLTGLAMILGRIAHAFGLAQSTGVSPGRVAGMALTWLSLIAGALTLLVQALG